MPNSNQEGDDDSSSNIFHPSFPHHWRICSHGPIRPSLRQPEDPNSVEYYTGEDDNDTMVTELFPDQIVAAKLWRSSWIRTEQGYFLPRNSVTPYTPAYRVVADTHPESEGVAPYVIPTSDVAITSTTHPQKVSIPKEIIEQPLYDPHSPLCRNDLKQLVGHIFQRPALLLNTTSDMHGNPDWWTSDGQTWWPTKVRAIIPIINKPFPGWIPIISKTQVTEWATPVDATYVRKTVDRRGTWVIFLLILVEQMMIVFGAGIGVKVGWTMGLQGAYLVGLVVLVSCEVAAVACLVPNGHLWLTLNKDKLPEAIMYGMLWRWDLYGDVGFSILAYQRRDVILTNFWFVPVFLTSIVILCRLVACLYAVRKRGGLDELSLSNLSVPSFLTIFELLCQNLQSSDLELAAAGAYASFAYEILRVVLEDTPECIFQAIFLFGPDAPPTCPSCSSGFVLVSLFSSFVALLTTLYKAYTGYSQYQSSKMKLAAENEKSAGAAHTDSKATDDSMRDSPKARCD
eukprot:scaffold39887_cov229-Amphora_coffeaeformis.AAC.4